MPSITSYAMSTSGHSSNLGNLSRHLLSQAVTSSSLAGLPIISASPRRLATCLCQLASCSTSACRRSPRVRPMQMGFHRLDCSDSCAESKTPPQRRSFAAYLPRFTSRIGFFGGSSWSASARSVAATTFSSPSTLFVTCQASTRQNLGLSLLRSGTVLGSFISMVTLYVGLVMLHLLRASSSQSLCLASLGRRWTAGVFRALHRCVHRTRRSGCPSHPHVRWRWVWSRQDCRCRVQPAVVLRQSSLAR